MNNSFLYTEITLFHYKSNSTKVVKGNVYSPTTEPHLNLYSTAFLPPPLPFQISAACEESHTNSNSYLLSSPFLNSNLNPSYITHKRRRTILLSREWEDAKRRQSHPVCDRWSRGISPLHSIPYALNGQYLLAVISEKNLPYSSSPSPFYAP